MTVIEERVVAMKFDNAQFEKGIQSSLNSLSNLNKGLQLQGATKGLTNVAAATQQLNTPIQNVEKGVSALTDRFKTMGVVGMAAISNITNQAIFAGQNLVKSLTLDPITKGFQEYETNINSIQTILANTASAGVTLKDVTKALDELNHYSDQTIYNFAEMAKNIGTFTAAGVDLDTSVESIKGIANLAAMSGTNSERAAAAMYQLSQAISSGTVSLEDWNSVEAASMGGAVFKRALAETAVAMGVLKDNAVKLEGPMKNVTINGEAFRKSISSAGGKASWLTSDVLTQTLRTFTGDLTDAQLAAMGFEQAQIKAIQAQAKVAVNAATQVKTFSQLVGALAESTGSGWAQTWKTIFGDFEEAKTLFTNVNNVIGGFINGTSEARNRVLADWKELGGRTYLIEAISNAFNALVAVIKPIGKAFRDIFPATTGKQLADMSKAILEFSKGLKVSGDTAKNIGRTFKGFFAVIDIGWMIIKEFVKTILDLVGVATEGSGGLLEFTARIGDWLVSVRDAIKNGEGLRKIFEGIGKVLAIPIRLIKSLLGFLGLLAEKTADINLLENFSPMEKLGALASFAWERVLDVLTNVWDKMQGFRDWASGFFGELGQDISDMLGGIDFSDVLAGINTGIFATIALMLNNLIGGGGVGGILENLTDGFEAITGSLQAMQNTLRAATLLQIAAAILILSIAMDKLSKIDQDGLVRSGAAITTLFANLMGAMFIFEKFSSFTGFAKMPFVAASMILLATAVNILATAVTKLSGLSWEELAKGLTATTVLLGALVGVSQLMGSPKRMISTAIGLVILAGAIKILATAVKDLSELSWEELSKGLVGVGAVLAALGLFTKFANADKGGIASGLGIILLATGIKILASAVKDFSGMSWEEIGRGLVAMGGGLAIVAGALKLLPPSTLLNAAAVLVVAASLKLIADALADFSTMQWDEIGRGLAVMAGALVLIAGALALLPPTSLLSAAAIFVVAASLGMIGDALSSFSEMGWEEIAKGLVVLAGALGVIAGAMILMTGALPGAAALLVVAASMAILAPILKLFSGMTWEEIAKGLVMFAGALAIIGVAGVLLTPVIPTLLGLGTAIALLGAGLALAGAGVLLFATGLTLLAAAGGAAAAVIVAIVSGLVGLLPLIAEQLGVAILVLARVIKEGAPALGEALLAVLNTLIDIIVEISPKVVDAILKLLLMLLDKLAEYVPKMADAAGRLIVGILNGIARNIGKIVTAAVSVVTAFIGGISKNLGRVIQSGVDLILKFVNGIADAIRKNSKAMGEAGANLATAIIEGMARGLAGGIGVIASKAKEVARGALNAAMDVLGIASPSKEFEKIGKYVIDGFRKGLDGNKQDVWDSFATLRDGLKALTKSAGEDVDKLEAKLKKLRSSGGNKKQIAQTKKDLAQARKEEKAAKQAYATLTKNLRDETSALGKLADKYDVITAKLEAAQGILKDAIKTRDDFNKQIADQYSDLPSATGETKLEDFLADIKKQVEDTKTFANAIQQLRGLGLNDEVYKDLLAAGPEALPFIQELLASGKAGVEELNNLEKELNNLGGSIGKVASSQLYQAGVDAAAGLVKGLEQQQAAIEKQMDKIADAMVKSIKKKLGIKSPSKEFAKIGVWSAEGLTAGLNNSVKMVEDSAANVGSSALTSLQKTLSDANKMSLSAIDTQPVIRPVLDLSDIRKNAGQIGSILPTAKMTVAGAYSRATEVSSAVRDNQTPGDDPTADVGGTTLNYTQNNYSPKAISSAEVYRQTKNQLSTTKEALATNAKQS